MITDIALDRIARFLCDLDGVIEPSNDRWEKERQNAQKILDILQEETIYPSVFYTIRNKNGHDFYQSDYPVSMLSDGTVESLKESARRMDSDSVYGTWGPHIVMKHTRHFNHSIEPVE